MYVYKDNDYISNSILKYGSWEKEISINFLKCLKYYSEKMKLSKNQVTVLDIGANLGWYSYLLGNAGYEIIAFEASHINDYILKKTFCLNQNVNVTLINKALGLEEQKCLLQHPSSNVGNAVILCGENINIGGDMQYIEEIEFTRLSNYIPYLSNKNLALIKIDVEGSEGKVVKSGIDLITKYHIPFIYIEFTTDYLKMQGTNPRELLEIFTKNGYSISTVDFISKKYITIDEIVNVTSKDLYLVYSKFLE
jgi:FkbM family methyltransferase